MAITDETKIYYCEHCQEDHGLAYMNVYAGETVRFFMCRLCSTVALGTIVSARIMEGMKSLAPIVSNVKDGGKNG